MDGDQFDAVFFTGYHAWASCPGNPLSHTMNLKNNFVTLNGQYMSEFMMNAYTAAYYGVPVTFLSGDEALCEFAKELIPGITTVAVNRGVGGAACSIHPAAAVREIREKAEASLTNLDRCRLTLPDSFEMVVSLQGAPPGLQPLLLPRRPALGPHSGGLSLPATGMRCCASLTSSSATEILS